MGIAVARMVPSRATRKVVIQTDMKMRIRSMPVGYLVSSESSFGSLRGLGGEFSSSVDFERSGATFDSPPCSRAEDISCDRAIDTRDNRRRKLGEIDKD